MTDNLRGLSERALKDLADWQDKAQNAGGIFPGIFQLILNLLTAIQSSSERAVDDATTELALSIHELYNALVVPPFNNPMTVKELSDIGTMLLRKESAIGEMQREIESLRVQLAGKESSQQKLNDVLTQLGTFIEATKKLGTEVASLESSALKLPLLIGDQEKSSESLEPPSTQQCVVWLESQIELVRKGITDHESNVSRLDDQMAACEAMQEEIKNDLTVAEAEESNNEVEELRSRQQTCHILLEGMVKMDTEETNKILKLRSLLPILELLRDGIPSELITSAAIPTLELPQPSAPHTQDEKAVIVKLPSASSLAEIARTNKVSEKAVAVITMFEMLPRLTARRQQCEIAGVISLGINSGILQRFGWGRQAEVLKNWRHNGDLVDRYLIRDRTGRKPNNLTHIRTSVILPWEIGDVFTEAEVSQFQKLAHEKAS